MTNNETNIWPQGIASNLLYAALQFHSSNKKILPYRKTSLHTNKEEKIVNTITTTTNYKQQKQLIKAINIL